LLTRTTLFGYLFCVVYKSFDRSSSNITTFPVIGAFLTTVAGFIIITTQRRFLHLSTHAFTRPTDRKSVYLTFGSMFVFTAPFPTTILCAPGTRDNRVTVTRDGNAVRQIRACAKRVCILCRRAVGTPRVDECVVGHDDSRA